GVSPYWQFFRAAFGGRFCKANTDIAALPARFGKAAAPVFWTHGGNPLKELRGFGRRSENSLAGRRECAAERPACARAAHHLGIFLDRLRPADKIALDGVALFAGEELALLLGLHAFGNDRQVESAAERDHGADDRRRLLALPEIGDKGLV